jgi:asparagine synthase (glutamine-hydrolysing)
MNGLMIERGPDDEGRFVDPEAGVALGARRLSILDVEGGHQPLANEDGNVWAVLNGEIYNYPALREQLLLRGHRLATSTDTEVLVHLYEDFGVELVHALEGMFAFALWDGTRRRLLLARDRFGEKPLFYAERAGGLAFASELAPLTAGAPLEPDVDPRAVDAFFVLGYVPGPGTVVKGVRQLPPGHRMTWSADAPAARIERYWTQPQSATGPWSRVDGEMMSELEAMAEQSVGSRMLADVPLGVFLSGGTDSMLVAALAARVSRDPIRTFTVDYDTGDVGEAQGAREVARAIGADHHELVLTSDDVAARVPTLLGGLDQPLADQALVALHAVSEFARPHIKVALGGEGADEIFAGYPRYRWLQRSEQLEGLLPQSGARALAGALGRLPSSRGTDRLATMLGPASMLDRHLDWVTFGRREARASLYGPLLRPSLSNGGGLAPVALEPDPDGSLSAASLMRLDLAYWLPDDVLAKADRASMRASLEMRTPYLNRQLAEFASMIPARTHLGGGGKRLLRTLLERTVPSGARRRPKRAFRVPADEWLRGPLRDPLRRLIRSGALFEEGWFDRSAASALVDEHLARGADRSAVLWPLLSLGLWLDRLRHGDGR